jgi:hypothetical protein
VTAGEESGGRERGKRAGEEEKALNAFIYFRFPRS